jgi:hypothetical protein
VYAGAPLLAIGIYAHQESRGAAWTAQGGPLSPVNRFIAVGLGLALAVGGTVGLIWPGLASALAPWPVSPLMARVFTAWFSAFAPGLLWFAAERDWNRVAAIPRLMISASVLDLVMLVIHRGDLTPGAPTLWLAVAALLGMGLLGGAMHIIQLAAPPPAARA